MKGHHNNQTRQHLNLVKGHHNNQPRQYLNLVKGHHNNQPRQYIRTWGLYWLSNYQRKMPDLDLKIHQYAVLLLTKYYYVLLKFFTSLICLWIDLVALLLIVIFAKKQPKFYRHDFDLYSWNDLWVLMSWIQFYQFMEVFINGLI